MSSVSASTTETKSANSSCPGGGGPADVEADGPPSIGIWAGYRKNTSSEQFFLAGKSLKWPMIGAALFTANISTIHLVSFAQEGFINGLAFGNFEWMAAFCLILLGIVFAPFYFRSRISTLPVSGSTSMRR